MELNEELCECNRALVEGILPIVLELWGEGYRCGYMNVEVIRWIISV